MFSPSFGQSLTDSESGESSYKNARVRGVYCSFHCILVTQYCPWKRQQSEQRAAVFGLHCSHFLFTKTILQIIKLAVDELQDLTS